MGSQNPTALVPNSKDEGSMEDRNVRAEIALPLAKPEEFGATLRA